MGRFFAHFWATDFAAPMVVTVCSSEEEFQALAMRLAARVLLPGTGWIAFTQLMDLVGLMMDLLGKRFLPRYLISAQTKTMVHNHGYYGTKSGLVWYLFSGRVLIMVFNILWILI